MFTTMLVHRHDTSSLYHFEANLREEWTENAEEIIYVRVKY